MGVRWGSFMFGSYGALWGCSRPFISDVKVYKLLHRSSAGSMPSKNIRCIFNCLFWERGLAGIARIEKCKKSRQWIGRVSPWLETRAFRAGGGDCGRKGEAVTGVTVGEATNVGMQKQKHAAHRLAQRVLV